jgi:hypothetical protein
MKQWDMEQAALDGAMIGLVVGEVLLIIVMVYYWLQ